MFFFSILYTFLIIPFVVCQCSYLPLLCCSYVSLPSLQLFLVPVSILWLAQLLKFFINHPRAFNMVPQFALSVFPLHFADFLFVFIITVQIPQEYSLSAIFKKHIKHIFNFPNVCKSEQIFYLNSLIFIYNQSIKTKNLFLNFKYLFRLLSLFIITLLTTKQT